MTTRTIRMTMRNQIFSLLCILCMPIASSFAPVSRIGQHAKSIVVCNTADFPYGQPAQIHRQRNSVAPVQTMMGFSGFEFDLLDVVALVIGAVIIFGPKLMNVASGGDAAASELKSKDFPDIPNDFKASGGGKGNVEKATNRKEGNGEKD